MFKRIASIALSCSLIFAFSSCASKQEKQKFSETYIDYFDTVSTIVGFEDKKEDFDKNAEFIEKELEEYHKLYDIYKSYQGINNLCTVNKNAGIAPVKVDSRIIALLDECIRLYDLTGGMTNVAMGSVLSIWHGYRNDGINDPDNAELPPMEKLIAASKHTDISKIIIDRENSTVFLSDPDMSLDIGAVAKGYATEQIALSLKEKGVMSYSLNIGGNIRTIGAKADGEKWTAAVTDPNPDSETGYVTIVELADSAFVTSGSYQRFYTVDCKQYHHIIDPETLMPKNDFTSVSVYSQDSGLADALSTALFNMSFEEGGALIAKLDGVEAMWITDKYELLYSDGFSSIIKKNQ